MDIVDVTIHVDESLPHDKMESIRDSLLARNGVAAASFHDKTPHLIIVEYDPETVTSASLLSTVTSQQIHAQLVGL